LRRRAKAWIPTFIGGLILVIAGSVLDWRIRVDDRARDAQEGRKKLC
jgi:hypothetical protein